MRPFLILMIPVIVAVVVFLPKRPLAPKWMDSAFEAIQYRDVDKLQLMLDTQVTEEQCAAFLDTLESSFWPMHRITPKPSGGRMPMSDQVEIIAQLPPIEGEEERTLIFVPVFDDYGRKGIFTLYITPEQDRILAMELVAEVKGQ